MGNQENPAAVEAPTALAVQPESTPLKVVDNGVSPLVQMFASGQVPLEQMQKLMDLQDRYEATEARKAYHEAIAKAKAEMPVAQKSGRNNHLNSTYATLDDYLAVANPVLAKFGLSVSWDIGEQTADSITTTCRISHQLGHSEASAPISMPITGGNNAVSPAQSVGIAMTYARRYSFTAILGMATEDADGNAPTTNTSEVKPAAKVDIKGLAELKKQAKASGIDNAKLISVAAKTYSVSTLEELSGPQVSELITALKQRDTNAND